ncbi:MULTISPECIES: carboxy terminal-processing peptidase [unclassified Leeuwenhoekiella]|uniref:carboxy terminal-processing peptidase n=1 Tax=unclassified Leeuwenhoekiella TaxID=2615029 RepID=UPI000C350484|nr:MULTISPECIES: carboxy terminal-processing peptidase [unclassified Leeuwenhoekiella]MAW97181.1 tail-specific protease [Leeuwenhoekiella sp.]MBA82733.1 tail-specific protease [Leeuwenhoekiella sp.]|tara:strand:- start:42857 stop:44986 length:2130 start_codon:yes stop_codon:yes gene_type:complete
MIKNAKVLVLALLLGAASCSFTTNSEDPGKDKVLISLISYVLEKGHYDAKDFDDEFSEQVFNDFITALDPLKRYFLASDIKEFEVYKDQIDDQIRKEDITFFDMAYTRLRERMEESKKIYEEVLDKPFDYTEEDSIDTDYENVAYAKNRKELKERWENQLKFSAIGTYYDRIQEEDKKAKDSTGYTLMSNEALEEEARKTTKDSYAEYFEFADELDRDDYFSVYINSIVEEFDPHTTYFAPVDKDRFDMQMSGQFQGIGARLQKKSNEISITEIISGGPAWRGEQLEEGDIILKVKQQDEDVATSVVGMRLDDAVELIKGPKGTVVTLNVKKKDGTIRNVAITRDVVELEETYAKTTTVEKEGRKYGVINLPKFYFDMQNANQRNAATDVKQEILRLQDEGAEGLVIDLRSNGGGSLSTVVDIAGLFIKEGPVVQVKSNGADSEILKDKDPNILWDKPLVILVNEISASASEILAAAMQDYKRAVIIGSKQTYGKGTVQNVYDLNRWLRQNDLGDMGALKITTQKFYRINGGSTQLEGVKSDVVVPDRYSYIDIGEKDLENPLPWDKIAPADYKVWDGYIDYEQTINNSNARMSQNEQLQLIEENAKWIKSKQDDSVWPLNLEQYAAKVEQSEAEAKRFDALRDYKTDLVYKSLPYELKEFQKDTVLKEKRQRWHEELAKDVYMEEAINVLEDLKINNIRRGKLADVRD